MLGVVEGCQGGGGNVVLMPRKDRAGLMASEVPLMYGMVVEVMTVGVCEGEFELCEVWEWRWMKVARCPFWARAWKQYVPPVL